MLTKPFSATSTQRIKQTGFSICYVEKWLVPSFQKCKCFCQLSHM